MSIKTEIDRINNEVNNQGNLIDEIVSIVEGKMGGAVKLQEKIVTPSNATQEITPDNGYDGLSKVIINGDSNLLPENIKKGVSVFGILGELSSVDVMYKETISELYTNGSDYEIINLKSLPYLPFIILVIPGEGITDFPYYHLGANQCAIYVRQNNYDDNYTGLYNDEHFGELDRVGRIKFLKKTDGTYDLDGIKVWEFYMPASNVDVGNKYTAILIGKADDE